MIAHLNSKEDIIMNLGRRYQGQLNLCIGNLQRKFNAEQQITKEKSAKQMMKASSNIARAREEIIKGRKARAAANLQVERVVKRRKQYYRDALADVAADVDDGI